MVDIYIGMILKSLHQVMSPMSLPATHKAFIVAERFGRLQVQDLPVPRPGKGQILVKVKAASLNPIDWELHKYDGLKSTYPISLGHDVAGDVVEVGEDSEDFVVGDRMCAS